MQEGAWPPVLDEAEERRHGGDSRRSRSDRRRGGPAQGEGRGCRGVRSTRPRAGSRKRSRRECASRTPRRCWASAWIHSPRAVAQPEVVRRPAGREAAGENRPGAGERTARSCAGGRGGLFGGTWPVRRVGRRRQSGSSSAGDDRAPPRRASRAERREQPARCTRRRPTCSRRRGDRRGCGSAPHRTSRARGATSDRASHRWRSRLPGARARESWREIAVRLAGCRHAVGIPP